MRYGLAKWTIERGFFHRRFVRLIMNGRGEACGGWLVYVGLTHIGLKAEGNQKQGSDQPPNRGSARSSPFCCGCFHGSRCLLDTSNAWAQ